MRLALPIAAAASAALLVALPAAGASNPLAEAAKLVTGRQIANGSITGADVKDRSLTGRDFRGSVRGPRGAQGPAGPQGPPGPSVLGSITRVEATITVPPGDVASATVNCPPGQGIVSGGYTFIAADGEVFFSDSFGSPTSWSVGGDNFDSLIGGELTAVAFCATRGAAASPASVNRARDRALALEARRRDIH